MAYATPDQLAEHLGLDAPLQDATRVLERASRLVNRALFAAAFDVDDPDTAAVLRTSTLEQCAAWAETGSSGLPGAGQWSSVAAGGISLGRATDPGGGTVDDTEELTGQAVLVLQEAGLLGWGPYQL